MLPRLNSMLLEGLRREHGIELSIGEDFDLAALLEATTTALWERQGWSVQRAAQLVTLSFARFDQWRDLESQLQALAAGSTPEPQLFERLVREFTDVHDDHLALEDGLAFPRAAALVRLRGDAALAEMGREMAERRGARLP